MKNLVLVHISCLMRDKIVDRGEVNGGNGVYQDVFETQTLQRTIEHVEADLQQSDDLWKLGFLS